MVLVHDIKQIKRYLPFYRSFLFHFVKFQTDSDDLELISIVHALNIKNRYKRIYFVVDEACDFLDKYTKGCNNCDFVDGKCICHRSLNKDYYNGCCRKCSHQSDKGCPSKNFACKLFTCSYVKNRKILSYKDISIIYLLSPTQRLMLKSDYYSSLEEVTKDLYYGSFIFFFRFFFRRIIFYLNK